MKLAFVLAGFVLSLSLPAQARDSKWLICSDDHLVLNVYEHRAGSDQRATDMKLIFGERMMSGALQNTDDGMILLRGKDDDFFRGRISVDYSELKVGMTGNALLGGAKREIDALFGCKEMDPNL